MPNEIKIEQPPVRPEAPKAPETVSSPEKKVEAPKAPETPKSKETPQPQQVNPSQIPSPSISADDEQVTLHKVESILSDGMERAYLAMDAGTQAAFKAKGEETSQKISTLLTKTKVQIKQVIGLIVDWLRIIPKVNKYYIEQEAKIKADAIMEIYNSREQK